ncbi:Copper-transporting ATPase [Penicillium capsulatum]|uniref:P-type Cu(+) transporter n=1 Tax=Penicillium capsulatum TaxID=69766 RepID=A0A9W9IV19_9EURO|nr:Copper-transporting ATPase [Penicillium capsulatum]KAJ6129773.1 Copper-transporting ATPase [Penicillium capsulatum]
MSAEVGGAGDEASANQPLAMATTTVKVDGMTCGACTSAVEAAFQGVDGAGEVSVSLMMGRAAVQHDPAILAPSQVAGMIEDCGFDAAVLSTDDWRRNTDNGTANGQPAQMSSTTLAIEGMTCGACTSAVESGLKDIPGVNSVNVSLLSERAVVEHDAQTISPARIADIIEDRGFGARVLETSAVSPSQPTLAEMVENKSGLVMTVVAIGGMTCGACSSSVENAFANMDGVVQFNISLLAERAVIVHDPTVLPIKGVTTIVEDAGFDASVVSSEPQEPLSRKTQQINLSIHGLRDADSATALEENLLSRPGIKSARINLANTQVLVAFDTSIIGIRSVFELIEAAGYNALIADSDDTNAQLQSLSKTKEIQEWRRAFMTSVSFAIPVFFFNMLLPMYMPGLDFGKLELLHGLYLGDMICLILTIPVQFGIGRRFYITSFRSLKHRSPTMDVLVMLGTSAAFFYSCFTMLMAVCNPVNKRPSTVFDTSTMLITFITLGRWLENRAKGQTSAALSRLMSLAPSMTTIYEDPIAAEKLADGWASEGLAGGSKPTLSGDTAVNQKLIATELIQVGDIVVLRPGDKVSADGVVIRGESYVDESMITGEALPIHKKKGSHIIAGTVNGTSSVDFKVIRAGKDTQLSQIVRLVQDAQISRAPIQRMADIVAGYFVPTIIGLGLITFFGWMFLSHVLAHPPKIFQAEDGGGRVMVCLKLCISVIVFACPCALGLSTPTAVMVGTGVGAEHGILVKGGAVLEAATRVNHVVFDKTGTLTTGRMTVAQARIEPHWTANDWRRRLWWLIVGLAEMGSEHPIGRAILVEAKAETGHPGDDGLPGSIGDFDACVGKGISAVVEPNSSAERTRYNVLLGNSEFLRSKNVTVPTTADPESSEAEEDTELAAKPMSTISGITRIHVAIENSFAGTIFLRDSIKDTSVAAVAALHRMGIAVSMVTGDTASAALSIASAVNISPASVHASASPSDKRTIIASLQDKGELIAMVGDGINDSPALATASVGIALASGTDVAMEAADIVLMRPDDLLSVPASLLLSRSVFRRIKLNLVWACLYNVIGLPFAMGLFLPFTGFMLPPMAAGAAMALSSVSVVVSSLLLKLWRRPSWMNVDRLEKETGALPAHSRSASWWSPATISDQPRFLRRWMNGTVSSLWSLATGKRTTIRDDEGYVPLQTVEPV